MANTYRDELFTSKLLERRLIPLYSALVKPLLLALKQIPTLA